MGWIKISVINVLVLVALLLGLEILARIGSIALSCIRLECNFSPLLRASANKRANGSEPRLVMNRPDSRLGYVPIEGLDGIRKDEGWNNKRVTITKEGFRTNGDVHFDLENEILAVGDSFTFGQQVANDETWPACLERKLKKGVANGGVPGYGTAQALERAKRELKTHKYKTIILSILVGSDFERDTRRGVIKTPNGLAWSPPRPEDYKDNPQTVVKWVNENSFAAAFFIPNRIKLLLAEIYLGSNRIDKEAIIPWTLNDFANIEVDKKIVLLQYGKIKYNYKTASMLQERKFILEVSSRLNLIVVDTFEIFSEYQPEKIWMRHHTPLGNTIVCDYLFEQAFK